MVHRILSTALFGLLSSSVAVTAYAQQSVEVQGRITSVPCSVSAKPVLLGSISTQNVKDFSKAFRLDLSGCDLSTLSSAWLNFTGERLDNSTFTLAPKQGVGMASGVGIVIFLNDAVHEGGKTDPVRLDGGGAYHFDVESGKHSFDFVARYNVMGQLKPGVVSANATVTVSHS